MAALARYVRKVVLLDTAGDDHEERFIYELRRRHRVRVELRLGAADRRQQPRVVVGVAYTGRRATDRLPN